MNPVVTLGEFYINGHLFGYTAEDVVRPAGAPKIAGKTAIPPGEYEVILDFSPKFSPRWGKFVQRNDVLIPHVLGVQGFTDVRLHWGNDEEDTEGCPLVGKEVDLEAGEILRSREAFKELLTELEAAVASLQKIHLHVGPQDFVSKVAA